MIHKYMAGALTSAVAGTPGADVASRLADWGDPPHQENLYNQHMQARSYGPS